MGIQGKTQLSSSVPDKVGCHLFEIPALSTDVSQKENVFNLVTKH